MRFHPQVSPLVLALVLAGLPVTVRANPAKPQHDNLICLFGNLHAHSALSGDIKSHDLKLRMAPQTAFEYAHAHGLDFLALCDHHQAVDAPGRIALDLAVYATELLQVADAYSDQHAGEFVAIPAIEWGNLATGNHVSLFWPDTVPPDSIANRDYGGLYDWARTHAAFCQFNHPDSWGRDSDRDRTCGNFGEVQIGLQEFPGRVNGTVRTVAVINSVKGGHISGSLRLREDKTHREIAFEETYAAFLNRGLRVSPTADQDTHTPNWGTVTACRTAVWSPTVTAPDLQGAFQANRVYVTEDDEMVVAFQVRYGGKRYWMGETVPLADDEEVVTVRVKIWQAPGNEGDPVEEGPYRVRLRVDTDGVGGDVAQFEDTTIDVETEQVAEFTRTVSPGQYFYLWIRELNGQDNPSGDARSDSPGDLNDSAMTSPVWFALADPVAPPVFIWSVNSQKYHDPHCWAVANILPENRREGPDPGGRTRHDCPAGP